MSHSQFDYHSMIEPYLRQQLSEEELTIFETRLLEDETLLQEVQRMEALQSQLRSNPGIVPASRSTVTDAKGSWVDGMRRWIGQPQSVFACLLLLIAFSLPLIQRQASLEDSLAPIEGIASSITLQNLRSTGNQHSVSATPPVLLTVDTGLPVAPASTYGVEIRNSQNEAVVLRESGLAADSEGWLRIVLHEQIEGEHAIDIQSSDGRYQNTFLVDFIAPR